MSWDNQGGNKGPWGNRGGNQGRPPENNSNDSPPDLDEMLRQAQDRLAHIFGGGGGGGSRGGGSASGDGKKGFGLIILAVLVAWLATGLYRVLPEENAVIMTFGKWTDTKTQPGLGYHIPWPVQAVQKVGVTFERKVEIGFRDASTMRGTKGGGTDVPDESLMLTGDENIIDIDFVVLWRITDAGKYLFEIRDPEDTIKKVAESAMREVIGRTPIQKAMTESRAAVEAGTKDLMQKMLDDYGSGVVINAVQLQKVDPPSQVVDAFDDVQRARADKERAKNEAEAYRNNILPTAHGEGEKVIQEATGYKDAVIVQAEGDAARFMSVYRAYAVSKDITQKRIYLETLEDVLRSSKKVIIDGKGAQGVLPYLPLETLKPISTDAKKP